jgi:murein DD-endopeptidase MepM/ murein hydrolase activator NlpD
MRRGPVLCASASLVALWVTAQAEPAPQAIHCDGVARQAGLLRCAVPRGDRLSLISASGQLVREVPVPADGQVTLGLERDAPDQLILTANDATLAPLTIDIAPRQDPFREITGFDCDKVDARTEAQKAHASRSWVKKQAAFRTFAEGPGADGGFRRPADGPTSSPFGPARRYVGTRADGSSCDRVSVHYGYDIAVPVGAEVRAPAPGTVTLGDPDLYYEGGTVFLDHGDGLVSVFMHMSEVTVAAGQSVAAGDRIGASGNTGRTTGPHLHWAVKWRNPGTQDRAGDFYIDPALLLELAPVP